MPAEYDGNNTSWHGGYGDNKETEGIKIEKFVGSPALTLQET